MIKLYKRHANGVLAYHEAWINDQEITEHWGKVGTRGESRKHQSKSRAGNRDLEKILRPARQAGFVEIDMDEHRRLIVEYVVSDMGTSADLEKRHRFEERLNQALGWTGLGECDGGSIGSGTMEVCCFVVDFAIAKSIVAHDLAGTEFADFSGIFDEDGDADTQVQ
jgi:hypothetical protein